jgi:hypothetical protein
VALALGPHDALGDLLHARDVGDAGPAVLLDDDRHGSIVRQGPADRGENSLGNSLVADSSGCCRNGRRGAGSGHRWRPACSTLIGGASVSTIPLFASWSSLRPRSTAAAAVAFFWSSATVSALVQPACSFACMAFISSIFAMLRSPRGWPEANADTMPATEARNSKRAFAVADPSPPAPRRAPRSRPRRPTSRAPGRASAGR